MGKDDTFFFEEEGDDGLAIGGTGKEQADTFMSMLESEGIIKERGAIVSFDPIKNAPDSDTKKATTTLVEIEYGTVKGDYVLHVTPIHPHKNLAKKQLLEAAVKQTIIILNNIVPPTLKVDIFLPRADYEIKATSYVIRQAADAWNFDSGRIETVVVPQVLEQVGKICMLA